MNSKEFFVSAMKQLGCKATDILKCDLPEMWAINTKISDDSYGIMGNNKDECLSVLEKLGHINSRIVKADINDDDIVILTLE